MCSVLARCSGRLLCGVVPVLLKRPALVHHLEVVVRLGIPLCSAHPHHHAPSPRPCRRTAGCLSRGHHCFESPFEELSKVGACVQRRASLADTDICTGQTPLLPALRQMTTKHICSFLRRSRNQPIDCHPHSRYVTTRRRYDTSSIVAVVSRYCRRCCRW